MAPQPRWEMEMSLIGEPRIVENTLFVSCPSGKMQPLFFVTVSKLMHRSNLVRKHEQIRVQNSLNWAPWNPQFRWCCSRWFSRNSPHCHSGGFHVLRGVDAWSARPFSLHNWTLLFELRLKSTYCLFSRSPPGAEMLTKTSLCYSNTLRSRKKNNTTFAFWSAVSLSLSVILQNDFLHFIAGRTVFCCQLQQFSWTTAFAAKVWNLFLIRYNFKIQNKHFVRHSVSHNLFAGSYCVFRAEKRLFNF
jgi:hypothetical protein